MDLKGISVEGLENFKKLVDEKLEGESGIFSMLKIIDNELEELKTQTLDKHAMREIDECVSQLFDWSNRLSRMMEDFPHKHFQYPMNENKEVIQGDFPFTLEANNGTVIPDEILELVKPYSRLYSKDYAEVESTMEVFNKVFKLVEIFNEKEIGFIEVNC